MGQVKVGDEVMATDPETGEQVAKKVEHVFVHDETVTDLVVDGAVIGTTEDHPFWSLTDRKFERADELSPGEQVPSTIMPRSWHDCGMPRERVSTTVDPVLLAQARDLDPDASDASMIERALMALLAAHRKSEIDARYASAYAAHPLEEPDEWGDLASFGEAVRRQ